MSIYCATVEVLLLFPAVAEYLGNLSSLIVCGSTLVLTSGGSVISQLVRIIRFTFQLKETLHECVCVWEEANVTVHLINPPSN